MNCVTGDRAIILHGSYKGYTVTVHEFVGALSITSEDGGEPCNVPDVWMVRCPTIKHRFHHILVPDTSLQPIRGAAPCQAIT